MKRIDIIPKEINNLADSLTGLPGIGPKSALRLATYITQNRTTIANDLYRSINSVLNDVAECTQCGNFTTSDQDKCTICSDLKRNMDQLMIVETPIDLIQIENSRVYNGYYLILGGVLSPLNGITTDMLNISLIPNIIDTLNTEEVILAIGSTVEGDSTANYLSDYIRKINPKIIVSKLAKGVPTGVGIEYLDSQTLSGAITKREQIDQDK